MSATFSDQSDLDAAHTASAIISAGGEMGALMRSHDWSQSPLGPPAQWPDALKVAINICLGSRFPMVLWWGAERAMLYNDAWRPVLGATKHPGGLGRPGIESWREIWPIIGEQLDSVIERGQATWSEDLLLVLERFGYPEEAYFTYSYSPIHQRDGTIGGAFSAVTETTKRVVGERRLRMLRDLAEQTADAQSVGAACSAFADKLGDQNPDIPFALLYLVDADAGSAQLCSVAGLSHDDARIPRTVTLADADDRWGVARAVHEAVPIELTDLQQTLGDLPGGAWPEPARAAMVMPVGRAGQRGVINGVLVAGISPRRAFDSEYRGFLDLVAGQLATALGNAAAYAAERRRAEELAELDRSKTAFFSNISHEFRTPLTLMLGPLEELLVKGDRVPDDDLARVASAHRNGRRLLKLVNALLDFSRIEAGRMRARFEHVDLSALTAELASNFRSATDSAGLELVVDCEPLPETVCVDRDMWEKVVLNLMSNAFKFTFTGQIEVCLRAAGTSARLTVRDTGTGIPRDQLPRLFERFYQVTDARGRSYEGSGIGLALVHELVGLHGGTIEVDSTEGEGSTFAVSIPFGTMHLPQERIAELGSNQVTSSRAQDFVDEAMRWLPDAASDPVTQRLSASASAAASYILLADDNADMRDYVSRLLATRHEVRTVGDGQAALAAVRERRPDLLLTDIMMPNLDGFGLITAIRDDPALRDLPIIVLSARAGEDANVEGLSAGADDYLVKPFAARELSARVDSALALAKLRREHTETLRRLNEALEIQVEERTRERDRVWNISRDLFLVGGDDLVCRSINPAWCVELGFAAEAVIGARFDTLVHPDDRGRIVDRLDCLFEGGIAQDVDVRIRAANDSYRWYSWKIIRDDAVFYAAGRDVSVRKELEEQLRQAQKMDAVGKLTGGVAHDFNNLLQVIGGNLQLLARDIAGNARAEQRLQNAHAGVTRGAKLASQLLAFGRRQPLEPKVVNLGRFVRGMDDMMRRALGDGIEIETIVSGGLWNTMIDPSQVENALLNLAINARDAMAGHGKLTVEAGNASLDDDYVARHPDVTAGQYVMLAVTDTGSGIPADVLEHVFEPFFTTKPEGQGTGLGLSMVWGLVKQSHGHIKIYSEATQGTTIRIYLPRVRQDEDVAVEADNGPVTGGTETVLVAEDDEAVRATVVEMLGDLGYRVLKAKDAQSALAIVESGVPIDLLFTDVVMPGPLRSPELARKVRERLPGIAVLFTSGYTDNAIVHGGRLDEGIDLLSKPYTREAMARKLRHVLSNQRHRNAIDAPRLPAPTDADAAADTVSARPLRILLVEDEALIRMTTEDMLSGLGHVVFSAADAAEGQAILAAERIDVLLTDVELPGLSGTELAIEARRKDPALRIVFASGRDSVPDRDGSALADATLLRKPYNQADLQQILGLAT